MSTLKILKHLCFIKQNKKINKKSFFRSCLECFSSENDLIKHKEDCVSINGKQSVNLEKGIIEFENYFKQLPVLFKFYDDFEFNLRDVEIYEGSYTKKLFVLMIDLVSQLLFLEVKMLLMNLSKQFLNITGTAKKQ